MSQYQPGGGTVATVGVIVPAAGSGRRLGDLGPKALVHLAGRPLLAHVLADLEATACVTAVTVATHPDAFTEVEALASAGPGGAPFAKVAAIVVGGDTRQRSVAAGLAALPESVTHVAVHDAARPLAGPGYLDELLGLLLAAGPDGCCGVVPGIPVTDTIREVGEGGRSAGLIDRGRLRGMQTPQLFTIEALRDAHAAALRDGVEATDDAALVERVGGVIRVVEGRPENLKVTTPIDLLIAETLLARRGDGAGRGLPEAPPISWRRA